MRDSRPQQGRVHPTQEKPFSRSLYLCILEQNLDRELILHAKRRSSSILRRVRVSTIPGCGCLSSFHKQLGDFSTMTACGDGQTPLSLARTRRQQISKFLFLSEGALSSPSLSLSSQGSLSLSHLRLRSGNEADPRRVPAFLPVRPSIHPSLRGASRRTPPPFSPASLRLDLTKEGRIHAAEKFLSFSLSLLWTLECIAVDVS